MHNCTATATTTTNDDNNNDDNNNDDEKHDDDDNDDDEKNDDHNPCSDVLPLCSWHLCGDELMQLLGRLVGNGL
jgi:hypothetical protein